MLETSLYTYLQAETNITAITSTRIYPHFRDQESALPALSFRTVSKPHIHNLSGSAGCSRARVQIDSWAADLETCMSLAEQVRQSLQGFRGSMSGTTIGQCLLNNETHLHERNDGEQFGTFHIASDFLIIFDEEIPS